MCRYFYEVLLLNSEEKIFNKIIISELNIMSKFVETLVVMDTVSTIIDFLAKSEMITIIL